MFEKTLQDLVKGIRSHKRDPSAFISQSIQEIKQELRSTDPFVKGQAVRKLTYLQMMGYDMSWAAFSIVEVMSAPRFAHKRIGYLAACQNFTESTDVVLLCTNLLKKEFQSPNQYEVGLAVNCLANIVTRDLARDLIVDILSLINHSKPYVRKKSVLSMYKLYVKYPQGLRLTFDKLKEKLEDADSAVVSCAVNVICELANKNPKNYLAMAPKFFRLLTTSSNNWMLIKVVKLLGSLVPEEPRLARKLLEPLATIIQNTAAKSLLYECIHTMTLALPFAKKQDGSDSRNIQAVVALSTEHLRQFVEDPDQNLKYLGLVGFVNLMKSHPKAVVDQKELILHCLSDDDVTIRMKALELLTGMVTKRNLIELVHKLMQHVLLAEGQYRDEIIQKIIFMCSRDKYAYLSDVAWYVSVLVDLSYVQGPVHGPLVAAQLMDVAVRAESVREYAVKCMLGLLLEPSLFMGQSQTTMQNVLYAAGWIIGEYADLLPCHAAEWEKPERAAELEGDKVDVFGGSAAPSIFYQVVDAYLDPRATNLPQEVQVVYMQNLVKVFAAACKHLKNEGQLERILSLVKRRLTVFMQSVHIEVQERATTFRNLLVSLGVLSLDAPKPLGATKQASDDPMNFLTASVHEEQGGMSSAHINEPLLHALCAEPVQPVNPKAQRKVPVPDGLDLESAFDKSAFEHLESYANGGASKPPDLAHVCFTHIYLASEADEGMVDGMYGGSAGGTPARRSGYEEAPGVSPGSGGRPRHSQDFAGGYQTAPDQAGAHRNKWQSTPFYLQSSVAPVTAPVDENEIDSIPIIRLTSEDLKGRAGAKENRGKKGKHSRQRSSAGDVVAPVLKDEVMPEGAVDSGNEDDRARTGRRKRGGKDVDGREPDLRDIDITTPLRPDEIMPRSEHRPMPSNRSGASPLEGDSTAGAGREGGKQAQQTQTPTKERRHRKESKKGEGRKDARERKKGGRSSRAEASAVAEAVEAPLIDLDDFSPGPRRRDNHVDTSNATAASMDLLSLMDSPPRPAPAVASEPRPPVSTGSVDMLGLGSPVRPSANGAQHVEKKKSSKRSSRSRHEHTNGTDPSAGRSHAQAAFVGDDVDADNASSSSASTTFKPIRLQLLKTDGVRVEYTLAVDLRHTQVTVSLRVKNVSAGDMSDVTLTLEKLGSFGLSVAGGSLALAKGGGSSSTLSVARTIAAGDTVKGTVVLRTPEVFQGSVVVPALLQYSTEDLLNGGGSQFLGRLRLPVTAFFVPGKVSATGFAALLAGDGDITWHEATVRVSRKRKFDACVEHLSSLLRSQILEMTSNVAATFYARTVDKGHVAVLSKFGEDEVTLAVKSDQQALLQEIVSDIQQCLSL